MQRWKMETVEVSIVLPRDVLSALRQDPDSFVQEMRVAAAVKWYELEQVSQGKAAEIAGLSRAEFIDALNRYEVSLFQYSADEIAQDLAGG
jgi:predicted HTH domain antitoxin